MPSYHHRTGSPPNEGLNSGTLARSPMHSPNPQVAESCVRKDWTENWFSRGVHTYGRISEAVCSTSECSLSDVIKKLNEYGVHPNQTRVFVPNQTYIADVDILGPFSKDEISTTAIYKNSTQIGIRNQTLSNHVLHSGVVKRTIIIKNESYHICTEGSGSGPLGGPNIWFNGVFAWEAVDQLVIDEFK